MATWSSILPGKKIPWMEEPGQLQSMESERIRRNWAQFKCIVWWVLTNPQCLHFPSQHREPLHHPRKIALGHFALTLSHPHLQMTIYLIFCHSRLDFPLLEFHVIVSSLLWLASFINVVFLRVTGAIVYIHWFICSFQGWIIFHCADVPELTC